MNEHDNRPLPLLAFLEPRWFNDPSMNFLAFGSFEPEVLSRVQTLSLQRRLSETRELLDLRLELSLGLLRVQVKVVKVAKDEYIVRTRQRGLREQQTAV